MLSVSGVAARSSGIDFGNVYGFTIWGFHYYINPSFSGSYKFQYCIYWNLNISYNNINNDLLKVALYSNIYTVDGGKTREVVITANNLGISPSSDVRTVIVSNGSNNPSIYFVSNTQWEVGIGVHIYISNNSSQANIAIRVTALYI